MEVKQGTIDQGRLLGLYADEKTFLKIQKTLNIVTESKWKAPEIFEKRTGIQFEALRCLRLRSRGAFFELIITVVILAQDCRSVALYLRIVQVALCETPIHSLPFGSSADLNFTLSALKLSNFPLRL